MVKDIFIEAELQQKFNQQGFVTFPLLNDDAIKQIHAVYDKWMHAHPVIKGQGYNISSYSSDKLYKDAVDKEVSAIVRPFIEKVFKDFRLIGSTFAYKVPDKAGYLSPHQEWSMVDEEKHVIITCWIPLMDIHPDNGMLYVLPGSHYANHKCIRGIGIDFYYKNYTREVERFSIPVLVKAGQAVIMNQSLIHYSTPNISSVTRRAVITTVKSDTAEDTILYYSDKAGEVLQKYIVPERFALEYDDFFRQMNEVPKGVRQEIVANLNKTFTRDEIIELFRAMRTSSGIMIAEDETSDVAYHHKIQRFLKERLKNLLFKS